MVEYNNRARQYILTRPIFDFVQDAKPNLTLLQPSYFCHKKILGVGFRFEQNHRIDLLP